MFQTHTITIEHSDGTVVAQHLPMQLDTVNIPLELMANRMIPVDMYDAYSIVWVAPVPQRSDYLVDEATGTKYSVYGNIGVYDSHLEMRIVKYTGPN